MISLNISYKVICCNTIKKILGRLMASGPCFLPFSNIFELLIVPQKKSDFYKALHKLNNQISENFPVKGGNFIFGLMQFTKSAHFLHIYAHSFLFASSHCPHCICCAAILLILILTQLYLYLYLYLCLRSTSSSS